MEKGNQIGSFWYSVLVHSKHETKLTKQTYPNFNSMMFAVNEMRL